MAQPSQGRGTWERYPHPAPLLQAENGQHSSLECMDRSQDCTRLLQPHCLFQASTGSSGRVPSHPGRQADWRGMGATVHPAWTSRRLCEHFGPSWSRKCQIGVMAPRERSKKQGLPPKSHSNLMPWRGLPSAKDPQEEVEGEPIPAPGRTRVQAR